MRRTAVTVTDPVGDSLVKPLGGTYVPGANLLGVTLAKNGSNLDVTVKTKAPLTDARLVSVVGVTPLTTAAEVLLASDHDAYVRGTLRFAVTDGWAGHGALAWRATDPQEASPYLMGLGEPADVALLVEELLPQLRDRQRVTLPRGTAALLPAWVELRGTDWDFRWLDAPPPVQPGEDRVVEVDDAAVAGLLPFASPTASTLPGAPGVRGWLGVLGPVPAPGPGDPQNQNGSSTPEITRSGSVDHAGDEVLLACVADTSAATGVGHLSSIAVHPAARGQGLGRAVTAAMARRMFASGCDLVTLGMYADNVAGRALYDGLGMHDDHRFTSGPLRIRSRW